MNRSYNLKKLDQMMLQCFTVVYKLHKLKLMGTDNTGYFLVASLLYNSDKGVLIILLSLPETNTYSSLLIQSARLIFYILDSMHTLRRIKGCESKHWVLEIPEFLIKTGLYVYVQKRETETDWSAQDSETATEFL